MDLRLHIVAIVAAVLLFGVVFELVRRRRMQERYALVWLLSAAVLLGLSVSGGLLGVFSGAVGIAYPPSALFAVVLATVVLLLLHFSLVISSLVDRNKILAQRLSMLQRQLDELR